MIPSKPLVLGLHSAHDAAAAVCSPKGILCAVAEERLTRVKHHYGFPRRAVETVLEYLGLRGSDIDLVAFSNETVFYPGHPNSYVVRPDGSRLSPSEAMRRHPTPRGWIDEFGPLPRALLQGGRRALQRLGRGDPPAARSRMWEEFADRHWSRFTDFLHETGLMGAAVTHYYVSHHRAHAASAFRLSGLDEACVITMDGKGDHLSATIYRGQRDGRMDLLRSSRAEDSLGAFYQAVTEALGFVPVDGEHKTMGLAALGRDDGRRNPFNSMVRVEDGVLRSTIPWTYRSYNDHHPSKRVPNPLSSVAQADAFKELLEEMPPEQLAHYAQAHCEGNMLAYASDAMRITGCTTLAAAGGVMLNVKGNSLIRDLLRPTSFFVFPDAGDSGLAVGAAMEALFQAGALGRALGFTDPYMGHAYGEDEMAAELAAQREERGYAIRDLGEEMPSVIADHLVRGKVIGTFQGRMEMGPRALGNRSVLADPRSNSIKDRINLLLKGREPFVPFAPVLMEGDAPLFWDGPTDYRYMTFCVQASEFARGAVPAVVHFDGSTRPQVVSRASNPWLYAILGAFKELTGFGLLLNTSFNRHGHPIVGSPRDALEHLRSGWVDGVAMGRWYVERPLETSGAEKEEVPMASSPEEA